MRPDTSSRDVVAFSWRSQPWLAAAWSVVAAFGAYFCMYGFRKPFTAASFSDTPLWGSDYKTILVICQVLGYATAKFVGIKVVSEISPRWRAATILLLVFAAHLSLLLFGVLPPPYNAVCMYINGLMLGMVFGLVLGFLEGRCLTEALSAGLCASFILADGATKSVGAWLLMLGVTEFWMPFAAGALFLIPLLLFVGMLAVIPPPNLLDIEQRTARVPMSAADRWRFFARYGIGLGLLVATYLMITILRSVRADFAPEIWTALDYSGQPSLFWRSEVFVALGVVVANGLSVFIRDNRTAFLTSLGISAVGMLLIVVALVLQARSLSSGFVFMVLVGLGLYLPYVAVHTTVFERLIAMTRERGNVGYLLYLADAFGYLGYVAVMLLKTFSGTVGNMLTFFTIACWLVAGVSLVCLLGCWQFFRQRSLVPPAEMVSAIPISEAR